MNKKLLENENSWPYPTKGIDPSILLRALKEATKNMPDNTMIRGISVGARRKSISICLAVKLNSEMIQEKTTLLKQEKIRSSYIIAKENEECKQLPPTDYPYYPFTSDFVRILQKIAFKRYIPKNTRIDIPLDYIKKQAKLILYLSAVSNDKVEFRTGFQGSPIFGGGLHFLYEKEGGIWRETVIGEWIS